MVEDLDVGKLWTIAQEVVGLYEGSYLWLKGILGFEPRFGVSKVKTRGEIQAMR